MSAHALLSASAAEKWLNCPPSARLEETMPESTTSYAEEGRLAHAIAELKLRKYLEPMGPRKFNSALKKLQTDPLYQPEMLKHTDTYVEYVQSILHQYALAPYATIEKKVDYSAYAPEGFGTADCIVIGGVTMHVIDFKYGKGVPVSAQNNPQMMLYAIGAYAAYAILYGIENIKMAIVQPRIDNISECTMTIEDLLAWGESIKPIAQKAYFGEGECKSGDHCRFCRAKSQCRARAEIHLGLEEFGKMLPPLISNEEVGQILERAQNLARWVKDLEDYALAECLMGNEIPGWKAVEGRSIRQFVNLEAAFKTVIDAGYDEALLYERKPITLTAVENLLGKAKFSELLAEHVNKPAGKPALVAESDRRDAIKPMTAKQAFSNAE